MRTIDEELNGCMILAFASKIEADQDIWLHRDKDKWVNAYDEEVKLYHNT